jgi:hypothetical protein
MAVEMEEVHIKAFYQQKAAIRERCSIGESGLGAVMRYCRKIPDFDPF